MIGMDRKIVKTILEISDSYDSAFSYHGDDGIYFDKKLYKLPVPPSEIKPALLRLIELGYLKQTLRPYGVTVFSITPELKHARAFWFDRVTKRFLGGFVTGVTTAVATGLILRFIAKLF